MAERHVLIRILIQHHPGRAALVPELLRVLPDAVVIEDPDPEGRPSPWRCYRHCLEQDHGGADHVIVLQDDVEVCDNFAEAAALAVAAKPEDLVSFYVGGNAHRAATRVRQSAMVGVPWAQITGIGFCPAVALSWPAGLIGPFLAWVDAQRGMPQRADDMIIGRWLLGTRRSAWATCPSLVEHPDLEQSLIGNRAKGGRDRRRTAACFIPEDCDPRLIDWAASG